MATRASKIMSLLFPRLLVLAIFTELFVFTVTAHSHVEYLLVNGVSYPGFIPKLGSANPPKVIGWATTAMDDGFVPPSNYTQPDIVCHRGGTSSIAHVPVAPGDRVHFQWNGWPQSHNGPIQTYLAACDSSNTNASNGCASVDKTKLELFKMDDSAPAFLNDSGGPPGLWATEVLIVNNNSWLIEIPTALAPGPYVLRHEIIALHYANTTNGAQNYPQCFNLWVTGPLDNTTRAAHSSTGDPTGTLATNMYHEDEAGILVDIDRAMTTYAIPGPALASNAVPIPVLSQTNMLSKAVETPVLVVGTTTVSFPLNLTAIPSSIPLHGLYRM